MFKDPFRDTFFKNKKSVALLLKYLSLALRMVTPKNTHMFKEPFRDTFFISSVVLQLQSLFLVVLLLVFVLIPVLLNLELYV